MTLLDQVKLTKTTRDKETNEERTIDFCRPCNRDNWPMIAMCWWDDEDEFWVPIIQVDAHDASGNHLGYVIRTAEVENAPFPDRPYDDPCQRPGGTFTVHFATALEGIRRRHHCSYCSHAPRIPRRRSEIDETAS